MSSIQYKTNLSNPISITLMRQWDLKFLFTIKRSSFCIPEGIFFVEQTLRNSYVSRYVVNDGWLRLALFSVPFLSSIPTRQDI